MNEAILKLPRPPGVNQCFGNRRTGQKGRGRYITPAYAEWKSQAGRAIMATGNIPRFAGAVTVEIHASEVGMGRKRIDGDNLIKPTLDLLVSLGCLRDDGREFVRKSSVSWSDGDEGTIAVHIREVERVDPQKKRRGSKDWAVKAIKKKLGVTLDPSRIHIL